MKKEKSARDMRRFGKLLVEAVLFLIISIPVHEHSHAAVIHLLGGRAVVSYDIGLGVTVILSEPSFPFWYTLAALAGGTFIGISYLILSLLIRDTEASMALRLVSAYHFSYAITEGFGFTGNYYAELIIVAIGLTVTTILSKPLLQKLFE